MKNFFKTKFKRGIKLYEHWNMANSNSSYLGCPFIW